MPIFLAKGPIIFTIENVKGEIPDPDVIRSVFKMFVDNINKHSQFKDNDIKAKLSFEATEFKILEEATKQEKIERGE